MKICEVSGTECVTGINEKLKLPILFSLSLELTVSTLFFALKSLSFSLANAAVKGVANIGKSESWAAQMAKLQYDLRVHESEAYRQFSFLPHLSAGRSLINMRHPATINQPQALFHQQNPNHSQQSIFDRYTRIDTYFL